MIVMDIADGCFVDIAQVVAAKMLRNKRCIFVWLNMIKNPLELKYDSEELMLEAYTKLRAKVIDIDSKIGR